MQSASRWMCQLSLAQADPGQAEQAHFGVRTSRGVVGEFVLLIGSFFLGELVMSAFIAFPVREIGIYVAS